jgi:hypothetical protein
MDDRNCLELRFAVEMAFRFLSDDSLQCLLHYLESAQGIVFSDDDCPSLQELRNALDEIFGTGAEIMLQRLFQELNNDKWQLP